MKSKAKKLRSSSPLVPGKLTGNFLRTTKYSAQTMPSPRQGALGEPGKGRSTQEEAPPSGVRTGGDWKLPIGRAQKSWLQAPEVTNPGSDFLHRRWGRGFGKWMSAWKLWLPGFPSVSSYFYLSLSQFWSSVSVAFGAFSQPPRERQLLDPAHSWTH